VKVAVDAIVFVSAAIRTGPSHRVVQAWLERAAFELVICPLLLGGLTLGSTSFRCSGLAVVVVAITGSD
jgi:predicted nucleic acid-binding protein